MITDLEMPLFYTSGALVGLGVVLLYVALHGTPPHAVTPRRQWSPRKMQRQVRFVVAGVIMFALTLVVTGWIVLALAIGALVALWDRLFGGSREERAAINRIEGLAAWTESLRDTIAGAVGLEQAIPATAINAAPSIRPSLNLLVDRLRVREPLPDALVKFADDLDDPSADLVVASLILNARLRGPGLRDVLTALADSARDELDLRRRVESSRRSTRRSVQIVVGVIVVMSGGLILLNGDYVAPYGTVEGQGVLAVVIALFALSVWWLRRLSGVDVPDRFLVAGNTTDRVPIGGAG
ncbi:type II secretion system F family protein [Solicola sp. PLA-1-18]|uniref:type II secretion system F family protein n=1 Tax=Solicola sp. PLA-1-18 TaxID=3380532 RepID=UPI003B7C917E